MCTSIYYVVTIIPVFFHIENVMKIGSPFFLLIFHILMNDLCVRNELDTVNAKTKAFLKRPIGSV